MKSVYFYLLIAFAIYSCNTSEIVSNRINNIYNPLGVIKF
ncbi:hypothetical protein AEQU1_00104 [Aequorivita sp. CIP111184]|nr:hypothetical protein AEQU1_00104 [Aequorivita sp. CIP111184]